MIDKAKVGDRIRVRRAHWARGGHTGTIETIDPQVGDHFFVRFDMHGHGFEGGWMLRLDASDLERLDDT